MKTKNRRLAKIFLTVIITLFFVITGIMPFLKTVELAKANDINSPDNILSNHGFETGDFDSWTYTTHSQDNDADYDYSFNKDVYSGYSSLYLYQEDRGGGFGSWSYVYQNFDITNIEDLYFSFACKWINENTEDYYDNQYRFRFGFDFKDSSGNLKTFYIIVNEYSSIFTPEISNSTDIKVHYINQEMEKWDEYNFDIKNLFEEYFYEDIYDYTLTNFSIKLGGWDSINEFFVDDLYIDCNGALGENSDDSKYQISQDGKSWDVTPIFATVDAASYYDYYSASSHTPYVDGEGSKIYFYKDTTTDDLSLILHHSKDDYSSSSSTIDFDFENIPDSAYVSLSDDPGSMNGWNGYRDELKIDSEPEGHWKWSDNSDGGVLSGLPTDESWSITINPTDMSGVNSWYYQEETETITLDMTKKLTISYNPEGIEGENEPEEDEPAPEQVKIKPLFESNTIEMGGELYLYYIVEDEDFNHVDNIKLELNPEPTGSKNTVISGEIAEGIAVASYDLSSYPMGNYDFEVTGCKYNTEDISFKCKENPVNIEITDRYASTGVGLTKCGGVTFKGINVEGETTSECTLIGNNDEITGISMSEKSKIGAGLKSTFGLEIGGTDFSAFNPKFVFGGFLGGEGIFEDFSPSEKKEIATLVSTRVSLTNLYQTSMTSMPFMLPLFIAAIMQVDHELGNLLNSESYTEAGFFASIQGTFGIDLSLGFTQETDEGEEEMLYNFSILSNYMKYQVDAEGSLKFYQDGKIGVKTWIFPFIDGEYQTFLGGGDLKNNVYIEVERIYKDTSTIFEDFNNPEKLIIKIGGKAKKEDIDTTKVKETLFNLYSPLEKYIKDITGNKEVSYLIEYEIDATNSELQNYQYLVNDIKGEEGYGFGILESIAKAFAEGYTAEYKTYVFDKTDYGIDIGLGVGPYGIDLKINIFENIGHENSKGYVVKSNYLPTVEYSNTPTKIDIPSFFIQNFDANILFEKIVKKPISNLITGIKYGGEEFLNGVKNGVGSLSKTTENTLKNVGDGLKEVGGKAVAEGEKFVADPGGYLEGTWNYAWGVQTDCPINVSIINQEGKFLGNKNNEIVNEIEGAYYSLTDENDFNSYLPPGAYAIIVKGTDTGSYDLRLTNYDENGAEIYHITNVTVNKDSEETIITKDQGFDFVSNQKKTYDLKIKKIETNNRHSIGIDDVNLNQGQNHKYKVTDWTFGSSSPEPTSPVKLEIDENNDGATDSRVKIKDGMTGSEIDANKKNIDLDEIFQETDNSARATSKDTPGFDMIIFVLTTLTVLFFWKRKNKHFY